MEQDAKKIHINSPTRNLGLGERQAFALDTSVEKEMDRETQFARTNPMNEKRATTRFKQT